MKGVSKELSAALAAIRKAGEEIMRQYASFEKIADAPANITTTADHASQAIIFQALGAEFPSDGLLGEESAKHPSNPGAPRQWIVDPIDGTRGFARKNGEFSVMIGLAERGTVIAGVVYEPAIGRVTYAERGQGCYVCQPFDAPPKPCRVATTPSLGSAVFSMSRSQGAEGERQMLEAFSAKSAIQTYSAGVKLAQVARGETDVYVGDYLHLKDWDVCAGHILVEEAGGCVTDLAGAEIVYGENASVLPNGLLATNGPLHAGALAVLATGKVVVQ